VDKPMVSGPVQNQDSYMQSRGGPAARSSSTTSPPWHRRAFDEYHALTGRRYRRVMGYRMEDADYVIRGSGQHHPLQAEAVADYLRDHPQTEGRRGQSWPCSAPSPATSSALFSRAGKGVVPCWSELDQPLAEDLPIMREVRATPHEMHREWRHRTRRAPALPAATPPISQRTSPRLYSGCFGLGSRDLQPEGLIAAIENMLPTGRQPEDVLSVDRLHARQATDPKQEILYQQT
jgi:pyruvate-ferredoxin/flavodoxin oxidoreductase